MCHSWAILGFTLGDVITATICSVYIMQIFHYIYVLTLHVTDMCFHILSIYIIYVFDLSE